MTTTDLEIGDLKKWINDKAGHWQNALYALIKAKDESEYLRDLVWKTLDQNIMNWDHKIHLHFIAIFKHICIFPYDVPFLVKYCNSFLLESTNKHLWIESTHLLYILSKHRLHDFENESIMQFYDKYKVLDSVLKILNKTVPHAQGEAKGNNTDLFRKMNSLIGNCCVASPGRVDVVLKLGYCDLAVLLMQHESWNVRDDVVWSLSMILNAGSDEQIHRVLDNKALVDAMVCCLRPTEKIQLKQNALRCLKYALTHGNTLCPYQVDLLSMAGAHVAICDLLNDPQILNDSNAEEWLQLAIETLQQMLSLTFNSPITKYFDQFKQRGGVEYLDNLLSRTPPISDELLDIATEFRNLYWDSHGNLMQDLNDPNSYWSRFQKRQKDLMGDA